MAIVPPVLRAGTRDLPDVPPAVQWLIGEFLAPILCWLETLVYRPLLRRCADHPLVLLARWYDPTAVVAACAGFHHAPGTPGAPPTFTIAQFVRAEMVRAWADTCSDPALEELLSTNLLVRWFVGLPLSQPGPDHSTLADFHAYLTAHAPDAFFRDVLGFLSRVDPEEPATTAQIVDTFAMASPVATHPGPDQLLRHLCLRLARCWLAYAPPSLQAALPPLDFSALARSCGARTAIERQQRLQAAVTVATWLGDGLTPHLPVLAEPLRAVVADYLAALVKVVADDLVVDGTGFVTERPIGKRGTRRLGSAVDLEATFRKHEGSLAVLGSNAVISITTTRIRAAVALTGSTPDNEAPSAVLEQQLAAGLPLPPYLVMDQIGGWGKTRARVDALSEGQTMMVARTPVSGGGDRSRFTVADFQVDAQRRTCICPNGVVSRKVYAHGSGDGISFCFLPSLCRDCPLWSQCRDPEAKPNSERRVFISDYHIYLRAGEAFNRTPTGRALLAGRWQVEPTIAFLVRYQGCRRARRVGQAAAQCQLYQACAMRNLLLWLSRLRRGLSPRPAT